MFAKALAKETKFEEMAEQEELQRESAEQSLLSQRLEEAKLKQVPTTIPQTLIFHFFEISSLA